MSKDRDSQRFSESSPYASPVRQFGVKEEKYVNTPNVKLVDLVREKDKCNFNMFTDYLGEVLRVHKSIGDPM